MCSLRWGCWVVLAIAWCGLQGCGKADPAAAPAGGGLGGIPVIDPLTAPGTTAPGTTAPATAPGAAAAVAGSVPASPGVDAQIQQRVIAAGAKFKPGVADAGLTKNQMKELGLAFHNCAQANEGFPSVSGIADKGATAHHGLSWRVSLLPYLDEAQLYQEFHYDEPWDSPHNLKLIPRMPKCFGVSAEGKSRVHVLTGNGAPFKQDERLKFTEVTDGLSNTIMVFVGGADTAEIWTKPVGRAFDPQDPLKSLGNVGDKFWVTLMDGAVRQLPKSIPADTFAKLVQHSDGQAITDFGDVPSSPAGSPATAIKINPPVTALAPASPKLALNFIPDDAFLAIAVHPRRIVNHPLVKAVCEQFANIPGQTLKRELPWDAQQSLDKVQGLRAELGIAIENLDEVILVLDKSLPDAMRVNPFAPPPFGIVAKNSAPLDIDGMLAKLTKEPDGMALADHEGVAIVLAPRMEGAGPQGPGATGPSAIERMSVAFLSDSVVLAGAESVVRKMISARASTTASTALEKQLESLGNPLIVAALDSTPVEQSVRAALKDAPVPVSLFVPYIAGTQTVNLAWDLDAKDMLSVSLKFKTPELAQGLFGMLDQQFKTGKEQYAGLRGALTQNPTSQSLVPFSDQLIGEIQLTNTAETIALAVPQIKNLDKLPQALQPVIAKFQEAAEGTARRNNMKQIGLAFHNFESTYRHFPAYNGVGEKSKPNPGLSWRVYLLPYLDQAPLYTKFNLNEPWDSPTNLALIKPMPKVFGNSPEGKTSIHLFTGAGAPFAKDIGPNISDVKDGLSNTILAVEAGDDVAEIWTKPTALEFDPADPWKCLGAIREFQALFMDGSVRKLNGLDKENLSRLIQHADGMQVNIP